MAVSIDQFVQQLTDSGLLSADEVAALRDELAPPDVEQFARELVKTSKRSCASSRTSRALATAAAISGASSAT